MRGHLNWRARISYEASQDWSASLSLAIQSELRLTGVEDCCSSVHDVRGTTGSHGPKKTSGQDNDGNVIVLDRH
jgi:hypothetical protein